MPSCIRILNFKSVFQKINELLINILTKIQIPSISYPLYVTKFKICYNEFYKSNKLISNNRCADGSSFFNHYFIKLTFLQEWKEITKEDNWNNVFLNLENRLNNIASKEGEISFNVPMAYIECEK